MEVSNSVTDSVTGYPVLEREPVRQMFSIEEMIAMNKDTEKEVKQKHDLQMATIKRNGAELEVKQKEQAMIDSQIGQAQYGDNIGMPQGNPEEPMQGSIFADRAPAILDETEPTDESVMASPEMMELLRDQRGPDPKKMQLIEKILSEHTSEKLGQKESLDSV